MEIATEDVVAYTLYVAQRRSVLSPLWNPQQLLHSNWISIHKRCQYVGILATVMANRINRLVRRFKSRVLYNVQSSIQTVLSTTLYPSHPNRPIH